MTHELTREIINISRYLSTDEKEKFVCDLKKIIKKYKGEQKPKCYQCNRLIYIYHDTITCTYCGSTTHKWCGTCTCRVQTLCGIDQD